MRPSDFCRVYRLNDRVSVTSETPYLTASQAQALGESLIAAARDIDNQPRFSESNFPTHTIFPCGMIVRGQS